MDESVQKHIEESLPKVGRFQHYADAMLRGCRKTTEAECHWYETGPLAWRVWMPFVKPLACAHGAIEAGWWGDESMHDKGDMVDAYKDRYGTTIMSDNDHRRFTREQIAARIAAL